MFAIEAKNSYNRKGRGEKRRTTAYAKHFDRTPVSGDPGLCHLRDGKEDPVRFFLLRHQGHTGKEGKGKRTNTEQFVIQCRGGRGVTGIKLDLNDYVVAALPLILNESILIVGKPNSICIPCQELSEQGRTGSGTKVIERSIVQTVVKI